MNADQQVHAHYLRPGELLFARTACEVTTVLGSCVAVTMCSLRWQLAAMCHAMLPEPGEEIDAPDSRAGQYVSLAVPAMVRWFREQGAVPSAIEVKLFGGSQVLGRGGLNSRSVGSANVALTRHLLSCEGLSITRASVGGHYGRKIIFDSRTGMVRFRRLPCLGPGCAEEEAPVRCPPCQQLTRSRS